jgi:hypothetical protein
MVGSIQASFSSPGIPPVIDAEQTRSHGVLNDSSNEPAETRTQETLTRGQWKSLNFVPTPRRPRQ